MDGDGREELLHSPGARWTLTQPDYSLGGIDLRAVRRVRVADGRVSLDDQPVPWDAGGQPLLGLTGLYGVPEILYVPVRLATDADVEVGRGVTVTFGWPS